MKQLLFLLALLVGLGCQSQVKTSAQQPTGTVEVVRFKLKDGISDQEGRKKLLALNECIKEFNGFISRSLTVNEAGEWLDLVYWTSKEAALKAASEVSRDPKAIASFSVIDESTMSMSHYSLVQSFNN